MARKNAQSTVMNIHLTVIDIGTHTPDPVEEPMPGPGAPVRGKQINH